MASDNPIIIDDREPEFFQSGLLPNGIISHYEPGDYIWMGWDGSNIGVERKEINDFLISWETGRLTDQSSRMVEAYQLPFLLIEGRVDRDQAGFLTIVRGHETRARQIPFNTFELIKIELQMKGMIVVETTNRTSTLSMIQTLYNWTLQPEHKLLADRTKTKYSNLSEELVFLSSLPTIGPDTARALLKQFGSPIAVINIFASQPAIAKIVPGVSDGRINRVRAVLLPEGLNGPSRPL
jgi:ERCC4-type nuclease